MTFSSGNWRGAPRRKRDGLQAKIGTAGDDVIGVSGDANGVSVTGRKTKVNIIHVEAANDRLVVNALVGRQGARSSPRSGEAADRV
jgi:hypothetical protein